MTIGRTLSGWSEHRDPGPWTSDRETAVLLLGEHADRWASAQKPQAIQHLRVGAGRLGELICAALTVAEHVSDPQLLPGSGRGLAIAGTPAPSPAAR